MNSDWRNELATEQQKEKLRFFGCTWDEGITAGQASDALEECAKQFPEAEAAYQQNQPATEDQKDKLRYFGCTWNGEITVGKASDALLECAKRFPGSEWAWQKHKRVWPESSPIPRQATTIRTAMVETPLQYLERTGRANDPAWQRWAKAKQIPPPEVTIQKTETVVSDPTAKREALFCGTAKLSYDEARALSQEGWNNWISLHGSYGTEPGCELTYGEARALSEQAWTEWRIQHGRLSQRESQEVAIQKAEPAKNKPSVRREGFFCGENEAVPHFGKIRPKQQPAEEITIQEAAKPQNTSPREYIIPARDVQYYEQRHPAIQKPATYISSIPIERFTYWLDIVLQRNNTCLGGHWLPVGPVNYPLKQYTSISNKLSSQIAEAIEARGYCVEPDARFGNGKYDKGHTLALFKPFDGDPIQPSTAYLGAANLLRLCVLITAADGQIDSCELDVFRLAIENQGGLSKTDHKRLLILEQLLAQELASASKTAAKIAKSIPAAERLLVGKLLVKVAAANNIISLGEHRALEQIFRAFAIRPAMLDTLMNQSCARHIPYGVQSDISAGDEWQWQEWRINHPGVVIDDTTLAGKTWNHTDWKSLNARWQDLHERLVAKQTGKTPDTIPHQAGSRDNDEQFQKSISWLEEFQSAGQKSGASYEPIRKDTPSPAPPHFALDMARVYEITSETKEVVALLSVLMEDEPEKAIAPSATITLPAPETPKVSSGGNDTPQLMRFKGLDAAFHPILERLLARDSWPKNDFKSLADEFHFMPLNIRDTLNEWSDETLGDFILDGEDPVVIRRELIAKEKVYG